MTRLLLSALAALFFALSSSAQLFYRIEGNGLSSPSYILGTHHLAPLSVMDGMPGWDDCLDRCGQLVGEIDMSEGQTSLAMKMQPYMFAPADSTITRLIGPSEIARVDSVFKSLSPVPGAGLAMFDAMRPMALETMLTVTMMQRAIPGFNPNAQLDSFLQTCAMEGGKTIAGLETPERQAELLFCGTPLTKQADALIELLDDPDTALSQAVELTRLYMAHDLEGLMTMAESDEHDPAFFNMLLVRRNAAWLEQLPAVMTKPSFIAVGALHLPGPDGLLQGLRNLGYTVTPIDHRTE